MVHDVNGLVWTDSLKSNDCYVTVFVGDQMQRTHCRSFANDPKWGQVCDRPPARGQGRRGLRPA